MNGVPSITNLAWVMVVTVTGVLMLRNLQWSALGRDMMAVREDEIAAASVGVDVVRTKVVAFAVAAGYAGVAGVLQVHLINGVDPQQAGFLPSIEIVVMVVLGGMGSLTGAVLGATALVLLRAVIEGWIVLAPVAPYENVIYPVLLLALMLLRREGLLGRAELSFRRLPGLRTFWQRLEGS